MGNVYLILIYYRIKYLYRAKMDKLVKMMNMGFAMKYLVKEIILEYDKLF